MKETPTKPLTLCLLMVTAILVINLLSGYIRHTEAGLGCDPWPQCFGLVGEYIETDSGADVVGRALTPTETAKQMHRGIATALVILIAFVVYRARPHLTPAHGIAVQLPYLLIAVVLILSVIGPASYLKTMPAIAVVNLVGGILLFILGWWLWLTLRFEPSTDSAPAGRHLATWALLILLLQICSGAWVSGNFAGAACTELLGCGVEEALPGGNWNAFWYFRELTLDPQGYVIVDRSQEIIHITHRLLAVVCAGLLAWLGIRCLQTAQIRTWAVILLILLGTQVLLGISTILLHLPLFIVLAHNLCATLLLAVVVRIKLLMRVQRPVSI